MPSKKPRYVPPEEVKAREGRREKLKEDLNKIRGEELKNKKLFHLDKLKPTPEQKKKLYDKTNEAMKSMSFRKRNKEYLSKVEME